MLFRSLEILVRLAHEDGKCVIIVTHSENVTAIADKGIGIREGKLLFGEEYQATKFGEDGENE